MSSSRRRHRWTTRAALVGQVAEDALDVEVPATLQRSGFLVSAMPTLLHGVSPFLDPNGPLTRLAGTCQFPRLCLGNSHGSVTVAGRPGSARQVTECKSVARLRPRFMVTTEPHSHVTSGGPDRSRTARGRPRPLSVHTIPQRGTWARTTLGVVAGRSRLPGVPAQLRRPRRRRRRRPAGHPLTGSATSSTSASTRSGCRRSTPRRWRTSATTSPTTATSIRVFGKSRGPRRADRRHPRGRDAPGDGLRPEPHLQRAPVVRRRPKLS